MDGGLKYKLYLGVGTTVMTVVLIALSACLQLYQFTSLEEEHIMLYDWTYIGYLLESPGGFAQILASLCTQFFIFAWTGPLITGLVYGVIIICLLYVAYRCKSPLWSWALAMVPCICLMLCLENSLFEYQGLVSLALVLVAVVYYIKIHTRPLLRVIEGTLLAAIVYYLAGPVAIIFVASALIYDAVMGHRYWYLDVIFFIMYFITGYVFYIAGKVTTLSGIYTPEIYYVMGSTYFMLLYAWIASVAVMAVMMLCRNRRQKLSIGSLSVALGIVAVALVAFFNVYRQVHSVSNYANQQQRYFAREGRWQDIVNMPYNGESTPYTSYRFLAMAHLGILSDGVNAYRPFIRYLLENKPKVKKRDQQIYSDIYYDCDYMAAARHAAFDTDIVTPGKFNPYETKKLAEINIVFGDYAVADKLLTQLEKTLFYSDWARGQRRFLYDDSAVESDPVLGPKRKAIPPQNFYLSPRGIQRDLQYIISANPDQSVAREFYKTFLILTNQSLSDLD